MWTTAQVATTTPSKSSQTCHKKTSLKVSTAPLYLPLLFVLPSLTSSFILLFFTSPLLNYVSGSRTLYYDSQFPQYTGLGIQENGEYCRSNGAESGCTNPDNAGKPHLTSPHLTSPHLTSFSFSFLCPFILY